MRFLKQLTVAAALAGATLLPAHGYAQVVDGRPVEPRARAPKPSPAAEQGPSAVEILNRSLNPGAASDPDVPLPHPDLTQVGPAGGARGGGTQVYGRQEEGGGVLGLRMPIPVDRGIAPANTTSGSVRVAPGMTPQGR